jgi:hypothetical protein
LIYDNDYRKAGAACRRRLMTDGNGGSEDGAVSAAIYIATLADELARLAKSHDLDVFAYILNMARFEADRVAKYPPEPADNGQPGAD